MSVDTGVFCPHCDFEFDYSELPWDENEIVDTCPSCGETIYLIADVTVRHKIAINSDEIEFVNVV